MVSERGRKLVVPVRAVARAKLVATDVLDERETDGAQIVRESRGVKARDPGFAERRDDLAGAPPLVVSGRVEVALVDVGNTSSLPGTPTEATARSVFRFASRVRYAVTPSHEKNVCAVGSSGERAGAAPSPSTPRSAAT